MLIELSDKDLYYLDGALMARLRELRDDAINNRGNTAHLYRYTKALTNRLLVLHGNYPRRPWKKYGL